MKSLDDQEMQAIFATQTHLIKASLTNGKNRLLEILQSSDTEYLALYNVQLFERGSPSGPTFLRDCLLRKAQITLAIPTAAHESPQRRLDAYTGKKRYSAFLLVPGYSLAGWLHLKGSTDQVAALTQELGSFFPLTNTAVRSTFDKGTPQEVATTIVNKSFISLFSIGELRQNLDSPDGPDKAGQHTTGVTVTDPLEGEVYALVNDLQQMVRQQVQADLTAKPASSPV